MGYEVHCELWCSRSPLPSSPVRNMEESLGTGCAQSMGGYRCIGYAPKRAGGDAAGFPDGIGTLCGGGTADGCNCRDENMYEPTGFPCSRP